MTSAPRPERTDRGGVLPRTGASVLAVAAGAVLLRRATRDVREGWVSHATMPAAVPHRGAPQVAPAERVPALRVADPRGFSVRGWLAILKRGLKAQSEHNTGLLAAGVTYYAFLSVFPALIAIVLVYGLVSTPADVREQVNELATGLPAAAKDLLLSQLTSLTRTESGTLSAGLVLSVATALFTASAAINGLMGALNVVYSERETRNIVRKRATSMLLTFGAVVFIVGAAFLLTVLPAMLDAVRLGAVGEWLLLAARWVGLVLAFMGALAVLYRVGPDRSNARLAWVSTGAVVAAVLWIAVSVGFSVYANHSQSYASTYGALAGVAILMLWLYFTSYAVLLGAEVNAQTELSTTADTTTGQPRTMGERGAYVADHVVDVDGREVGADGREAGADADPTPTRPATAAR